jgi:predicted SAM-dependent methyltransferase
MDIQRFSRLPLWLVDRYAVWCNARRETYVPTGLALNIGTGGVDLGGWLNLDESKPGDLLAHVPPIPLKSQSVDEVMLSHVVEHMPSADGALLLAECRRILCPGGSIYIIVPDMATVFWAWRARQITTESLNDFHIYSYCQESPHRWCYDWRSIRDLVTDAGYLDVQRLNRFRDPRLFSSAWYQIALSARNP